MSTMGSYCKAYELKDLRSYPGWGEADENARPPDDADETQTGTPRDLDDSSIVYLQENYVVTDGIYKDEYIIFDDVTEEWKEFCHDTLGFEIPEDVQEMKEAAQEEAEPEEPETAEA